MRREKCGGQRQEAYARYGGEYGRVGNGGKGRIKGGRGGREGEGGAPGWKDAGSEGVWSVRNETRARPFQLTPTDTP